MTTDTNLALNKPASHASTYSTCVASRAVDGLSDTESCTLGHVHSWWTVDLGAAYDIGHVTVTNYNNPPVGNSNNNALLHNVYKKSEQLTIADRCALIFKVT